MSSKRKDRRVERSKQSLRDALIELILEQGFDATSVADIAERANVGRSTFYSHFADKDDLLLDSIDHLEKHLVEASLTPSSADDATSHPALAFSLPMLEHADESRDLYRALVSRGSGAMVQKGIHDMLADLVRAGLAEAGSLPVESSVPTEVVVEFVVGAFWAITAWWLDKPSTLSAKTIDQAFRALVLPGLRGGRSKAS